MMVPIGQAAAKGRGSRGSKSQNLAVSIAPELLEGLLQKHCPTLNLPDKRALFLFATRLQALRAAARLERELFREAHLRLETTQKAIHALQRVLPEIAKPFRENVEFLEKNRVGLEECINCSSADLALNEMTLADHAQRVAVLDHAFASITEVLECSLLPFPVITHSKVRFQDRWSDYVKDVFRAYETAMRPTNPDAPLKAHHEGPGGRFITEIMSYVTGETKLSAATIQKKIAETLKTEGLAP